MSPALAPLLSCCCSPRYSAAYALREMCDRLTVRDCDMRSDLCVSRSVVSDLVSLSANDKSSEAERREVVPPP